MKKLLCALICVFSLESQLGMSGHTARPAVGSGSAGIEIDTINNIGPDSDHNFTIESTNSTVTITSVPYGIDLSVVPSVSGVETINTIDPNGSGNFTINAGMGVTITPGTNSISIAAPGGGSGVSSITADEGGFITGAVTLSGGSTGLTTDAVSSTEIELTGTLDVANGGTGATTLTGVLIGNGTSAVTGNTVTQHDVLVGGASNAITSVSPSTSGLILTSNGTGSDPSFQNNKEGVSLFVVDSQGNAGYTTIQSAVTAAAAIATSTTPQTVWIWPGTYSENLTLGDCVFLAGTVADGIIIEGTATYTSTSDTGAFAATGVSFVGAFVATGNHSYSLTLNECNFQGVASTGVVLQEGTGTVIFNDCLLRADPAGSRATMTLGTDLELNFYMLGCVMIGTGTPSIIQGGDNFYFNGCNIQDNFSFQTNNNNTVFCSCDMQTSNGVATITIGALEVCAVYNCTISSSATHWATGTGNLLYANNVVLSGEINPTLSRGQATTQTGPLSFDGGVSSFDPLTQGTDHQVLLGTGTSAVSVVSGTGTSGQALISNGSGAAPTWQTLDQVEGVSEFVVDSAGHTTYENITAAITAAQAVATATTPQTIWIWPGTYTENLTITGHINLAAAVPGSVFLTSDTTIEPSAASTINSFRGINFKNSSNAANVFYMTGSNSNTVYMEDCTITSTNGSNGIVCNNTSTVTFFCYDSTSVTEDDSSSFVVQESITASFFNHLATNSVAGSAIQGSAVVNFYNCNITDNLDVSGTATLGMYNSTASSGSNGNALFTIGSGSTLNVYNCFFTGEGHWCDSSGTVNYGAITTSNEFSGTFTGEQLWAGSLVTQPPTSNTVTNGFGNSLTAGTATQNTLGYDILVNVGVGISTATSAVVSVGIGPTSSPVTNPITPTFTTVNPQSIVFSEVIPSNYYILVETSGIITVTGIGVQGCGI